MEYDQTLDAEINEQQLTVSPFMKESFRIAALWARFLAIMGFVMTAIIIWVAVFAASFLISFAELQNMEDLNLFNPATITIAYLLIAMFIFLPNLFLFQFAQKMLRSIHRISQEELDKAILNLKRYFLFWGILTIIGVFANALAIILGIANIATATI